MLLSVQQKYILEALRELGSVRQRQLHVLVREKFRRPDFEISEARMETMLRQLRCLQESIRIDGELVRLPSAEPDPRCLEAIDIMLELSEGKPQTFTAKCQMPELLHFSLEGDTLRLFSVARCLTRCVEPVWRGTALAVSSGFRTAAAHRKG